MPNPPKSFIQQTVLDSELFDNNEMKNQKLALPFQIPANSWLHEVGKKATLKKLDENLFVKLEGGNPTGSIKDKAIANIVLRM